MSLADAREKARALREQVASGVDPLAAKAAHKAAERPVITFEAYATQFIQTHEGSWKNEVHRGQWWATMRTYVFPLIGRKDIAAIDTADILAVLNPIWSKIPDSAMRIRGRLEMVLAAAKAAGLRSGDNPAAWHSHLKFHLPRKPAGGHHEALDYAAAPKFWRSLRSDTSQASKALQFIILTLVRFKSGVPTRAEEINLEKTLWNVPGERMKRGETDFVVPLVPAAMDLVGGRQSGLLFPSPQGGGVLSSTALLKVARKHSGGVPVTVHGFRSTFRDWAGDCTDADFETAEACLSHKVGSAVTRAYRRGNALDKRRRLLDQWVEFLETGASSEAIAA